MHGYLYTADGFHGPPVVLYDRQALMVFLGTAGAVALRERRELRLTSRDDDDLYVYIQDGQVLHAGGGDLALFTQAILAMAHAPQPPTAREGEG
jgi:hypothetical protein